jgi:hypothetical protein
MRFDFHATKNWGYWGCEVSLAALRIKWVNFKNSAPAASLQITFGLLLWEFWLGVFFDKKAPVEPDAAFTPAHHRWRRPEAGSLCTLCQQHPLAWIHLWPDRLYSAGDAREVRGPYGMGTIEDALMVVLSHDPAGMVWEQLARFPYTLFVEASSLDLTEPIEESLNKLRPPGLLIRYVGGKVSDFVEEA